MSLLPTHPIYSLPPLQPSSLNASDNGNCASPAKFPTWTSSDWIVEDCYIAVQQLFLREVYNRPDVSYQFVAKGVVPTRSPLESQRTPRKYVFRTCVLTIMMLEWFHPGQLPMGIKYNRAQTDVSNYRDIYNAARGIETACTVSKSPGWLMTGKDSAMGVFVWSTNSPINELTGGYPVDLLGLNSSEVMDLNGVQTS
ncbi:hypothetical protein BDR22DRAFT_887231 [Usnea florida]